MKFPSRRNFLIGASGSMLALPWLEATAVAMPLKTPALRFASFYSPMGFVRDHFFPNSGSDDFLAMPTLSPLKNVGDKVTLIMTRSLAGTATTCSSAWTRTRTTR